MARMTLAIDQATTSGRALRNVLTAGFLFAAAAAALWTIPQVRSLEQQFGLRWLFELRGPVVAPANVAMVTMSRSAAGNIFLPRDPELYHRCADVRIGAGSGGHEALPPIPARWPRCLHAMLIEKLNRAGARIVVFDVLFRQRPPQADLRGDINLEQDVRLAKAMASSRNVVIAQKVDRIADDSAVAGEQLLTLSPAIEAAALGAAPFPLTPSVGRRIDNFLAFKEDGWATPSLPMVALQAYAIDAYAAFRGRLAAASGEADELLPADGEALRSGGQLQTTGLLLRRIFEDRPTLVQQLGAISVRPVTELSESDSRLPEVLAAAYGGPSSRLLNFYGPADTFQVFGFDEVLAMPDPVPGPGHGAFAGKAVFVGYAETGQAEQVEHFNTVYSTPDGIELSGVEIAATAFANLLDNVSLRPAPNGLAILIVFLAGLTSTLLCSVLRNRIAIPITVLLAAAYGGLAVLLFGSGNLWLPVVVPLLIAVPAGIAFAIVRKYLDARRQRDRVRQAFRMFVPKDVADELERNAGRIAATRRSLECVCVATDAAKFTTLAESMTPESVTDMLNDYFDTLFRPVVEHQGFVSDVVGDAMMAIWPQREIETRQTVCTALLEMRDAAEAFNRRSADQQMVTRFGAISGRVTLATIGAHAHYEYRAVGDPVNTASRIQELNKQLGTRILVSASVLGDTEEFLVRDLGLFLLRGKAVPEQIFELIETRDRATESQIGLAAGFEKARNALASGESAALAAFRALQVQYPDDGPTSFYIAELSADRVRPGKALHVG